MSDGDKKRERGKADAKGKIKPKSSTSVPKPILVVVSDAANNAVMTVPISAPNDQPVGGQSNQPTRTVVSRSSSLPLADSTSLVSSLLSSLVPELRTLVREEMVRSQPSTSVVPSMASFPLPAVTLSLTEAVASVPSTAVVGDASKLGLSVGPREAAGRSLLGSSPFRRVHDPQTPVRSHFGFTEDHRVDEQWRHLVQASTLPALAGSVGPPTYAPAGVVSGVDQPVPSAALPALAGSIGPPMYAPAGVVSGVDRTWPSGQSAFRPPSTVSALPPFAVASDTFPAQTGSAASSASASSQVAVAGGHHQPFGQVSQPWPGQSALPSSVVASTAVPVPAAVGMPSSYSFPIQGMSSDGIGVDGFPVSGYGVHRPSTSNVDFGPSPDVSDIQSVASEAARVGYPERLKRHKDITKTTLARWVSALIKHAYEWSRRNEGGTQPVLPLESARAHETRAWASSLAVLRSRRLEEVLHTAYWRSEDVFMNFYLRDISALRQDGSRALPAMVAGGQLLTRI
ncbi:uncharacterized protein [Littorina saxatilis]|uniref:uncharacterized protein n=1 Tax=Littorina saxatilis TaxID=31220 RepID=UPI0038B4F3A0